MVHSNRVEQETNREILWWKKGYLKIVTGFYLVPVKNSNACRITLISCQNFLVSSLFYPCKCCIVFKTSACCFNQWRHRFAIKNPALCFEWSKKKSELYWLSKTCCKKVLLCPKKKFLALLVVLLLCV